MRSLLEIHQEVIQKVRDVDKQLQNVEEEIARLKKGQTGNLLARIEKLKEQLGKIDDYELKIEAFRKLAEKNLESPNVLTIEAPPGYRVNLNRLRKWAMLIDPMSSNDPYAQRVYITAKCDLCFLGQKKVEFQERLEQLEQDKNVGTTKEINILEEKAQVLRTEFREIAGSGEMAKFAEDVIAENEKYIYKNTPLQYRNEPESGEIVAMGACACPLKLPKEYQGIFGKYFDAVSGSVWLPLKQEADREFAVSVSCSPARIKQLDKALQNVMLQMIETYPPGRNRIYVLDGLRYSSAVLGSLKMIEDTFAIAAIPRNPEQLTAVLEQIVSSFSDMDDILELTDSVAEFNKTVPSDRQLAKSMLVLLGWPDAYTGRDKEYIQRIMVNYERYGISFISVSYQYNTKKTDGEDSIPEYALQNAIRIKMLAKETYILSGEQEQNHFSWYFLEDTLKEAYATSLRSASPKEFSIGNEYLKRHPEFSEMPAYVREYKKIILPFGIDSKDKEHSMSFENENFAAYLVGASRSGKSTLLHTLIAGLIRNYHPDNVELWLADFKQLEFKKYMEHCPPHVKYILLDESTELVYDLLDKLTDEMKKRQHEFSRYGKERIDQLDPAELKEPMPVIFVILDEFSIMSQAIAESQAYRIKLQNLLAKGAALGIKFLFASQTFTSGVSGLTPTARAQIQQRIAMKGSREEISETLELSLNLKTEQVKGWMDALLPHYALIKCRSGVDAAPKVDRLLVMYFPDHAQIDNLIEKIKRGMKRGSKYEPADSNTYVNKMPVLVDGNSYDVFPMSMLMAEVLKGKDKNASAGEETYLVLGTPRLMTKIKMITVSKETRENILLVGSHMEQDCLASILTSAMRSFLIQKKNVQVWAYGKDPLYRRCRDSAWQEGKYSSVKYVEDMDCICESIRELKEKIEKREAGNELIVLLGFDRICADFEFLDAGSTGSAGGNWFAKSGISLNAFVNTPEEEEKSRMVVKELLSEDGNGAKSNGLDELQKGSGISQKKVPDGKDANKVKENLQYIVRHGSSLGYHFLLHLNNYSDFKATFLNLGWFRHRMAFQISAEDSREIFGNKVASSLPEHICQYYDTLEQYSLRPYLHKGIVWDGWEIGTEGESKSPFMQS